MGLNRVDINRQRLGAKLRDQLASCAKNQTTGSEKCLVCVHDKCWRKFRRQYPIAFHRRLMLKEKRLVVELDGDSTGRQVRSIRGE